MKFVRLNLVTPIQKSRFDYNGRGVKRLDFVGRRNGSHVVGWRAGGHVGDVFHDGFLYGPVDKNEDITGLKVSLSLSVSVISS